MNRFILKHIKNVRTKKHVIAYSDACSAQNRNIKIALTWMKIVQSSDNNIEIVDHKFLVPSYSFLSRMIVILVLIEMRIRKANYLYISEHYKLIIKN